MEFSASANNYSDDDAKMKALLRIHGVDDEDLKLLRTYGEIVVPQLARFIELFYQWMEQLPERSLLSDEATLLRVQSLQKKYWRDFFAVQIDADYISRRRALGETHARVGLSLQAYFAGMHQTIKIFSEDLYDGSLSAQDHEAAQRALISMVHIDTSIVVDTYSAMVNQTIREQSQALMELSTPVAALWDGILMLPVVGIIDSRRAQDIMNAMLVKIAETQAKTIILDISGVAVVDTAVANHLIKITKATRLMGCLCTISGISPPIAQTMVDLGIDVGDVYTTTTLKDALGEAFRRAGVAMAAAS